MLFVVLLNACCHFNACSLYKHCFKFFIAFPYCHMHDIVSTLTVVVAVTYSTHFIVFPLTESCTKCNHMHVYSLIFTPIFVHAFIPYCFQSPVDKSELPWPKPCLALLELHIYESEGSPFLPETTPIWPSNGIEAFSVQF